jgi:hypothetical protein
MLDMGAGWRWILKPVRPLPIEALIYPRRSQWGCLSQPDSDQNTAWQRSYTNLQSLRIEFVHVDGTPDEDVELYHSIDNYYCLTPARMTELEDWLPETEVLLRAKDVEIVLDKWCSVELDVRHDEKRRVPWLENMVRRI